MRNSFLLILGILIGQLAFAQQTDTLKTGIVKPDTLYQHSIYDSLKLTPRQDSIIVADTVLRILNLNPYFNLHVDSVLTYDLQINKESPKYFWFLKNAIVGLKINKDNGMLTFNAEKSYFRSGKLKYDVEYNVKLGVQNVDNPLERIDTGFTIVFYNTEINISKVKPSVSNMLFLDEGDSVSFQVQCETGTFPIETIQMGSNMPMKNYKAPTRCDDFFSWTVPFDFIKEGDTAKQKVLTLQFIGTDKFFNKDTASVRLIIKDGINYPLRTMEFNKISEDIDRYINQLKFTFKQLDRQIKRTKNSRTTFDLTSASTALGGTIATSINSNTGNSNTLGKVLPSVGVALVPVKEAVSPQKIQEQNTTTQIRSVIKRLQYLQSDNSVVSERDPDVIAKTKKLKDELKQAQTQLIDIPIMDNDGTETNKSIDKYFNDPKVNKKYRTTSKK